MEPIQQSTSLPVKKSGMGKALKILLLVLLLVGAIAMWWRFYYVFGEGVKSGELNFLVKKGYVFKTYEGKLIQSGIRSRTVGSVQSYEFDFSVANERIAQQLMMNSGKYFELHYKEYMGRLPWRGHTNFVVDSIIRMQELQR